MSLSPWRPDPTRLPDRLRQSARVGRGVGFPAAPRYPLDHFHDSITNGPVERVSEPRRETGAD
jgi:hypothetical protein